MDKIVPELDGDVGRFQSILLAMFGLRETSWQQLVWYCLVFSAVGSVIITSFQPFATATLPLWLTILHWFVHLFVAAVLVATATAMGVIAGLRMPWTLVVAVLLLPFLLAPFSMAVELILEQPTHRHEASFTLGQLYLLELVHLAPPSLGLSAFVAVFACRVADIAKKHRVSRLLRQAPELPLRSMIKSVPHNLGDDLIRAEAQDHYVRLVTTHGTTTLKMAFSDCVAALEGLRGVQCHRSHWVRFKHVQKMKRAGSAYLCILSDEAEIPVSRRRYSELKRNA